MLESIQAVSLLTIMEIVGPVLLLAVLIYGTLQCRAEGAGQHRPSEKPPRASSIGRALERKSGKKQVRRRRGEGLPANHRARDRSAMAVCSKSKLTTSRAYFGRYEQTCPPCPYCHEPMTPVFTIAPFEGLPEMLVLYCAPCKHVEPVAATSTAPNARREAGTPGVKRPALLWQRHESHFFRHRRRSKLQEHP